MLGCKSLSLVSWRQSNELIPNNKSLSTQGWKHSDELLHTSNIELRHVTVPMHIIRQTHTVEQTLASTDLTRLKEIVNSSTESRNTQAIRFKDLSNQVQKVKFEDSTD